MVSDKSKRTFGEPGDKFRTLEPARRVLAIAYQANVLVSVARRVTFVDTGLIVNIGQPLMVVEKYLRDEEVFLANYSDWLSDVNRDTLVDIFLKSKRLACFASVKPRASFHMSGFFLFRREVLQYVKRDLPEKLLQTLPTSLFIALRFRIPGGNGEIRSAAKS